MPALVSVLMTVLSSVAVKILTALGIGIVSYAGMQVVLDKLKYWVGQTLSGMPSDVYNIVLMAGVGSALGYIFGAYAFMITYQLLNKLTVGATK